MKRRVVITLEAEDGIPGRLNLQVDYEPSKPAPGFPNLAVMIADQFQSAMQKTMREENF